MRKRRLSPVPCGLVLLMTVAGLVSTAHGFTREVALTEIEPAAVLSPDCYLAAFNTCSNWIWVYEDAPGAVWGQVFDPNDCPAGCYNGGSVVEILLYARCEAAPAGIGGVRVDAVDANACPVALLCESGPLELTHCVAGDRWTTIPLGPACHLNGNPFAVSVVWGTARAVKFATDNGIANLYCSQGVREAFPGCYSEFLTCAGWTIPPQNAFVYVTDFNGDTVLDDMCALYGAPYSLAFPYAYGFGYLPNNLMIGVGLDCIGPSRVEDTTWGRVKAMYE